jgi:hypothetical protein
MTGQIPITPNDGGLSRSSQGEQGKVTTDRDAAGFAGVARSTSGATSQTAEPGDAGAQIRGLLASIDQLGASRSSQRAGLEQQIERLEALPVGEGVSAELANSRLLATLQNVQEVSFRVELATKVIDQIAGGIRTVTQTQV